MTKRLQLLITELEEMVIDQQITLQTDAEL